MDFLKDKVILSQRNQVCVAKRKETIGFQSGSTRDDAKRT